MFVEGKTLKFSHASFQYGAGQPVDPHEAMDSECVGGGVCGCMEGLRGWGCMNFSFPTILLATIRSRHTHHQGLNRYPGITSTTII